MVGGRRVGEDRGIQDFQKSEKSQGVERASAQENIRQSRDARKKLDD